MKRHWKLLAGVACSIAMYGCGSSEAQQGAVTPPGNDTSVADKLRALEERGELPKLDRGPGLSGLDADGDGLRDDLARYIDSLPETPERKQALRQLARSMSNTLIADTNDPASLEAASAAQMRSIRCLGSRFKPSETEPFLNLIRSVVVNTKERFFAYDRYNAARSGSVTSMPRGDTCE